MIRVRLYFALMATRHILLGIVLLRSNAILLDAPSLTYMVEVAPLWVWAVAMLVVGVLCVGGALWPVERPMRYVVVLSVVLTAATAAAMLLAVALDPEVSGVLAVLFSVLTGKDFLMLGLRWRDPFVRIERLDRPKRLTDGPGA